MIIGTKKKSENLVNSDTYMYCCNISTLLERDRLLRKRSAFDKRKSNMCEFKKIYVNLSQQAYYDIINNNVYIYHLLAIFFLQINEKETWQQAKGKFCIVHRWKRTKRKTTEERKLIERWQRKSNRRGDCQPIQQWNREISKEAQNKMK